MRNLSLVIVFLAISFILAPSQTRAYFTTSQSAFSADGKIGVFVINFSFGHASHEITIPVRAVSGNEATTSMVTYTLLNSTNNIAQGKTTGIVLGNVPISNGIYHTPKGVTGKFTLLVFYSRGLSEPRGAFHLAVTRLPFTFDGIQPLSLNPSELQYYVSPSLSLN